MLPERTRNMIVGLTLLLALVVLMVGIIKLGNVHIFSSHKPYKITLEVANANGVGSGTKVDIKGIPIGQVESTYLATGADGQTAVRVILQIDPGYSIPANAHATLGKPQAGLGQPWVTIEFDSVTGPMLSKDGTALIMATAADTGLIPKEVFTKINDLEEKLSGLAKQTTAVVNDMHVLLNYSPPEKIGTGDPSDPNRPLENLSTVIIRLDRTVAHIESLVGDPALQKNIRDTLQNVADGSGSLRNTLKSIDTWIASATKATESITAAAGKTTDTLETTQKEVVRISERLVSAVGKMETLVTSISDAKGTTGKLINDPRLYEGLVDLSKSLRSTVDDLNFMLKKWKDEGIDFHIK